MQIIYHRGIEALIASHSVKSNAIAKHKQIAYIEFDIQYTKNNRVVVFHDKHSPSGKLIASMTLRALAREMPNIIELPLALKACGFVPALIESKSPGTIARSLTYLKRHPNIAIASFHLDEVLATRINLPNHKTFLLQRFYPFGIIKKALSIDAHGIALNKHWLLFLPYYYFLAKKNNLAIYTYTINNSWLAKKVNDILPDVLICTDYPQKLLGKQTKGY